MYNNILIATDGSDLAEKAVTQGLELAKTCNARVTVLVVTDMWSALEMAHHAIAGEQNPISDYEEAEAAAATRILDQAKEIAAKTGVDCETLHVKDKHPAQGITDTAAERNCDLIVMSSHGRRGLEKILLGSVTSEVITHTRLPVLIAR